MQREKDVPHRPAGTVIGEAAVAGPAVTNDGAGGGARGPQRVARIAHSAGRAGRRGQKVHPRSRTRAFQTSARDGQTALILRGD
jgi:hypothetical protein